MYGNNVLFQFLGKAYASDENILFEMLVKKPNVTKVVVAEAATAATTKNTDFVGGSDQTSNRKYSLRSNKKLASKLFNI